MSEADEKRRKFSVPFFLRKAARSMWIFMSVIVIFILVAAGILQVWSYPGKPEPFTDEKGNVIPNSISEKVFLEINGVRQGMFIRGKNSNNPVLLYLHGGMPDYFLTEKYPTGLEDIFTVVWWEQRGSGISSSPGIPKDSLTLEQMIADTLELTNYLRQRFGQDKIYLMAHSGGSFIGIQAAARAPELYHAYIGVAQIAYQFESERLAYEYMLARFKANGNTDMVRKLESAPVSESNGVPDAYRALRDPAMHSLGIGTTHDMDSVVTGLFIPSLQSRQYTLPEKFHTWTAKAKSGIASLWNEMVVTDLRHEVTELSIPVYLLEGVYDYTCNYTLAKDYFVQIHAPVKGFYIFEKSAHSPIFEEPEKVQEILRADILNGSNSLADIK